MTDAALPPAWRRGLAYLTVALMPLSFNVEKLVGAKARTYFSPFDLLLPILLLLLLVDLQQRKPWLSFKVPPLPGLIWAGLALLSALWMDAFAAKSWLKGCVNPLAFGVLGVWVFSNLSGSAAEYRRVTLVLVVSVGACLLLALAQYAGPVGLPYDPRDQARALGGVSHIRLGGWYQFRNMLGAQVAMLVPVAAAFAVLDKDVSVRWGAAAIAALGLCVTLAAGGFIGACAGIVAVAGACASRRWWLTASTIVAALLLIVVVILPQLPRNNPAVLLRGVSLFAIDGERGMKATARARRYQAELNLLGSSRHARPVWQSGVGVEQFQGKVNAFYDQLHGVFPKPGQQTDDEAAFDMEADEPFSFGLWETVAVELGVPGLLALLFLFGTWIFSAQAAFRAARDPEQAQLALAALGAGCGALWVGLFTNPAIRGVGGSFAFLFALALWTRQQTDQHYESAAENAITQPETLSTET